VSSSIGIGRGALTVVIALLIALLLYAAASMFCYLDLTAATAEST
jgi:hypothetical protein